MEIKDRVAEWRRNELIRRAPNLKAAAKRSGLSVSRCSEIRRLDETAHRRAGVALGEAASDDSAADSALAIDLAAASIREAIEAATLAITTSIKADGEQTRKLLRREAAKTHKLLAELRDDDDDDDDDDGGDGDGSLFRKPRPASLPSSLYEEEPNAYAGRKPPPPMNFPRNVYARR